MNLFIRLYWGDVFWNIFEWFVWWWFLRSHDLSYFAYYTGSILILCGDSYLFIYSVSCLVAIMYLSLSFSPFLRKFTYLFSVMYTISHAAELRRRKHGFLGHYFSLCPLHDMLRKTSRRGWTWWLWWSWQEILNLARKRKINTTKWKTWWRWVFLGYLSKKETTYIFSFPYKHTTYGHDFWHMDSREYAGFLSPASRENDIPIPIFCWNKEYLEEVPLKPL